MKSARFQRRFYRDLGRLKDLYSSRIIAKETDLEILTNKRLDKEFVEERIRSYRWDIENYIAKEPRFLTSLKPISVELDSPPIIKAMAENAVKAYVGPMAGVAGAVAEFLGKDLIKQGYKDVIVENGGDIFIKTTAVRMIGLYAGKSKVWNNLKLKIRPKDTPLGVCTSSGSIGHSLSFGCADSVIVISKSALLADAIATATANRINTKYDMQKALDFARGVNGVLGVVIILRNDMLNWGKVELA